MTNLNSRSLRIARLVVASALLAVTIGAVVPPSGGRALGPVVAITPHESGAARPEMSEILRSRVAARTPASSTARSTSIGWALFDVPGQEAMFGDDGQGITVSGNGCATLECGGSSTDHHPFADAAQQRPHRRRSSCGTAAAGSNREVYRTPYPYTQQLHRWRSRSRVGSGRSPSSTTRSSSTSCSASTPRRWHSPRCRCPRQLLRGERRPGAGHLRRRQRRRGIRVALPSSSLQADRHLRRRGGVDRVVERGERRVQCCPFDHPPRSRSVSGDGRFVAFTASKPLAGGEIGQWSMGVRGRPRQRRDPARQRRQRPLVPHVDHAATARRWRTPSDPPPASTTRTTFSGRLLQLPCRLADRCRRSAPRRGSRAPSRRRRSASHPTALRRRAGTSSRRCPATDAGWRGSPTPRPRSASRTPRSSATTRSCDGATRVSSSTRSISARSPPTRPPRWRRRCATPAGRRCRWTRSPSRPASSRSRAAARCAGGSLPARPARRARSTCGTRRPNNTSTTNGSITVAEIGYDPISAVGRLIGRSSLAPPPTDHDHHHRPRRRPTTIVGQVPPGRTTTTTSTTAPPGSGVAHRRPQPGRLRAGRGRHRIADPDRHDQQHRHRFWPARDRARRPQPGGLLRRQQRLQRTGHRSRSVVHDADHDDPARRRQPRSVVDPHRRRRLGRHRDVRRRPLRTATAVDSGGDHRPAGSPRSSGAASRPTRPSTSTSTRSVSCSPITSDGQGQFRIPLSALGKLTLGSYILRVDPVPDVFDLVRGQLVVVLVHVRTPRPRRPRLRRSADRHPRRLSARQHRPHAMPPIRDRMRPGRRPAPTTISRRHGRSLSSAWTSTVRRSAGRAALAAAALLALTLGAVGADIARRRARSCHRDHAHTK